MDRSAARAGVRVIVTSLNPGVFRPSGVSRTGWTYRSATGSGILIAPMAGTDGLWWTVRDGAMRMAPYHLSELSATTTAGGPLAWRRTPEQEEARDREEARLRTLERARQRRLREERERELAEEVARHQARDREAEVLALRTERAELIEKLTEVEFDSFFLLLAVAGNETTTNRIVETRAFMIRFPPWA